MSNEPLEGAEGFKLDKAALIKDFKEWSGGFTPDEMEHSDVQIYVKHHCEPRSEEALFLYELAGITVWLGLPVIY